MAFYMFVYFMGIASCGMQGAEKMSRCSGQMSSILFSAGLNSFGGGFIRDVFLLSVFPAVFTPDCVPDIAVAMVAALVYWNTQHTCFTQDVAKWFMVIADAGGLGTFIAIGVDKAIDMGAGTLTAILSGILTSQGGGILAAVFCGMPLLKAISANAAYRLMAISGVVLYRCWTGSSTDRTSVHYAVILYTTIGALLSDQMITNEVVKRLYLVMDYRLLCPSLVARDRPFVFAPHYERIICYCGDVGKVASRGATACYKRTLLYHCLRLM